MFTVIEEGHIATLVKHNFTRLQNNINLQYQLSRAVRPQWIVVLRTKRGTKRNDEEMLIASSDDITFHYITITLLHCYVLHKYSLLSTLSLTISLPCLLYQRE